MLVCTFWKEFSCVIALFGLLYGLPSQELAYLNAACQGARVLGEHTVTEFPILQK